MEKKKTVIREYEVYHRLMRDAQVYAGDSLRGDVDLNDEECQSNWRDFPADPIVDVIFAKSEYEAVEKAAEDTGYHESNLYAIEHVVDAMFFATELRCNADSFDIGGLKQQNTEFRITGSSYDDGRLSGIEIAMPGDRKAFFGFDRLESQWKLMITESSYDTASEVWNMDWDRT